MDVAVGDDGKPLECQNVKLKLRGANCDAHSREQLERVWEAV